MGPNAPWDGGRDGVSVTFSQPVNRCTFPSQLLLGRAACFVLQNFVSSCSPSHHPTNHDDCRPSSPTARVQVRTQTHTHTTLIGCYSKLDQASTNSTIMHREHGRTETRSQAMPVEPTYHKKQLNDRAALRETHDCLESVVGGFFLVFTKPLIILRSRTRGPRNKPEI